MKQSLPSDRLKNRLNNQPEGFTSDDDELENNHKGLNPELKIVIYVAIGAVLLLFLSMIFWDDIMKLSKDSRHNIPTQEQIIQPTEAHSQDSVSNIKNDSIEKIKTDEVTETEKNQTDDKIDTHREPHSQVNEKHEPDEDINSENPVE